MPPTPEEGLRGDPPPQPGLALLTERFGGPVLFEYASSVLKPKSK
jgi:hypothetical protein